MDLLKELEKMIPTLPEDQAQIIKQARARINLQATILSHLIPEKTGKYFISGQIGELDKMGLPDKITIVPTMGADFGVIYEKTDKFTR